MKYSCQLVSIRYDDEEKETDNTFKDDIAVLKTNDINFISFVNLFRALYNFRVIYAGMEMVLTNKDYWPYINNARSAIKSFLNGTDKNHYKVIEKYILNNFKKVLDEQENNQINQLNILIKKLKESQRIQLKHEMNREIENFMPHPSANIDHNDLVFCLKCWNTYDYFIARAKVIIQERKATRFLTALGIVASFFIGTLSVLFTI